MPKVLIIFQVCLLKNIPFMEIYACIGSKFKSWIRLRVFDRLFLKLFIRMHPSLCHWCDRWGFRNIWDSHSICIHSLRYRRSTTGVNFSLSPLHVNCVSCKYPGSLDWGTFSWTVNTQSSFRCTWLSSIKFLRLFNNHPWGTSCSPLNCLPHSQYFFIDDTYASLCFNLSVF